MNLKNLLLLFIGILFLTVNSQTANISGLSVPKYIVGTSASRLPYIAKANISGLAPNANYAYTVRAYNSADISSTSFMSGAGNPYYVRNSGSIKYNAISPTFTNGATLDTFKTSPGGEYSGFFGVIGTSNSRFNSGADIFLAITAIRVGVPDTQRLYLTDTIKSLVWGSGTTNATGIYGKSQGSAFQAVSLFDNIKGTGRPLSNAIIENTKLPIASVAGYILSNVQAKSGYWGAAIPNSLSSGVLAISRYDLSKDIPIYTNIDSNGVWGLGTGINTVNPTGGTTALALILDEAPLIAPQIEFTNTTISTNEGNKTVVLANRKFSNTTPQKVRYRVVGNTATNGTDYSQINPTYINFKVGSEVSDTIKITTIDDAAVEGTETIVLQLDSCTNCEITANKASTISILDNDAALLKFINPIVIVKEDAKKALIKIAITAPINVQSSVKLSVFSKPAHTFIPNEFKTSFLNNSDTTFNIGNASKSDTISINTLVYDDIIADLDDTVILRITQLSGNAVLSDSFMTLIMEDNDGPSTVGFVGTSSTIAEGTDSITLKVAVSDHSGAQSDFAVVFLSNPSTASNPFDINYPIARIFSLRNSAPDTLVFRIPLVNDNIFEGTEKALFGFNNLNKTLFNQNDTFTVTITDNDFPYYPISTINKQSAPNFTPDSNGVRIRTSGNVYGINTRTAGLGFTINDNIGGIGIFSPVKNYNYTVEEGDSIIVQGRVSSFNGVAQLDFVDTIIVLAKNRQLKQAIVVPTITEAQESKLAKFAVVKLVDPSQWPTAALAANAFKYIAVEHANGILDSLNIDAETNIDGTPAPVGYFAVTGLGWQFDPSNPRNTNHYLSPRKIADFEAAILPIISLNKTTDSTFETSAGYTINLTVINPGQNFVTVVSNVGGNAVSGTDHTFTNTNVNVVSNTVTYSVNVPLKDDIASDGLKTIQFKLKLVSGAGKIGTDSTLTLFIKDNEPSSVHSIKQLGIEVFPIPTQDFITINSPVLVNQIHIFDFAGKLVKTATLNSSNKIDLSSLASANYYMVIELANKQIAGTNIRVK